jgi:hypothetical protein
MKRMLLLGTAGIAALALAAPAGAVPRGQGLVDPFPVTCEGVGTIMVTTPRGGGATAWSTTTGQHVVLQAISFETGGEVVFSHSFGAKRGLSTFTCTTEVEQDGVVFDVTVTVAVVPPA